MKENPLVSVIIPVYNRKDFLKIALDSVLEQTYGNFECLVIDDGSDNPLTEVKEDYQGDRRVRLLSQSHRGVSSARNLGIREASGSLLAFLDSDDAWVKRKLEKQVLLMENNPDALLSHTEEVWYRNGKHLNQMAKHKKSGGEVFERCLELCCIGMSTMMCRTELIKEIGFFREDFPACEDYELFLRFASKHDVVFLDEPLTIKQGGHSDQLSRQVGLDKFRIRALVLLLENANLSPKQREKTLDELGKKCYIYGNGCLKHGREEEGKEILSLPERFGRSHESN